MLRGDLPSGILPVMYGASLIAFSKPNGGVRPIAIGNTLRRLTAKAAAYCVKDILKAKLFPFQLGVSVSGGAEAIVHSARSYCKSKMESPDSIALLKIDFENAFNTIRQDTFLNTVRTELSSLYPFYINATQILASCFLIILLYRRRRASNKVILWGLCAFL